MAITLDVASPVEVVDSGGVVDYIEFVHQGGPDPKSFTLLIAQNGGSDADELTMNGLSFGGKLLTRRASAADTLNEASRVYIYDLVGTEIPAGDQIVKVPTDGGFPKAMIAVTLNNSAGWLAGAGTATAAQNQADPAPAITVSPAAIVYALGVLASGQDNPASISTLLTSLGVHDYGSSSASFQRSAVESGSVSSYTVGWTVASDDVAAAAIAYKDATAGSADDPHPFVGRHSVAGATIDLSDLVDYNGDPKSFRIGHVAIFFAGRNNATPPSADAACSPIGTHTQSSISERTSFKRLDGTETTFTFANADYVQVQVYRFLNVAGAIGATATAGDGTTDTDFTLPAVTPNVTNGTSRILGLLYANNGLLPHSRQPGPNRTVNYSSGQTVTRMGAYLSNPVASWAATTACELGTGSTWTSRVVELLVLMGPPVIETISIDSAVKGEEYSAELVASGGDETYEWEITDGALPTGLTLDADTGEISGTPTQHGTFGFTVQVTSNGETATRTFSLLVQRWVIRLELEDPAGGPGPFVMDNQLVANGVAAPKDVPAHFVGALDGTYHEIAATEVEGVVYVEGDGDSFEIGDHVTLHPDNAGTPLFVLPSAPGLAAFGRIEVQYDLNGISTARRNYARNNKMATWPAKPTSTACTNTGAFPGGSGDQALEIRDAEPFFEFKIGGVLYNRSGGWYPVVADVTADEDGIATLTVASPGAWALLSFAADMSCVYYSRDALPTGWQFGTVETGTSGLPQPVVGYIPTDEPDLLGEVISVADVNILIGGLTPGDVIRIGNRVNGGTAMNDAVVNGDGEARVYAPYASGISPSAPVTIERQPFVGTPVFGDAITLMPLFPTTTPTVISPLSPVKFRPDIPILWASVGFTLIYNGPSTWTMGPSLPSQPIEIAIWDGVTEHAARTATDDTNDFGTFQLESGVPFHGVVRTPYEMTESGTFAIRVRGPTLPVGDNAGKIHAIIRWVELSPAAAMPTDASPIAFPMNVIHQDANRTLALRHLWPAETDVLGSQMVGLGLSPEEVLVMGPGQEVRAWIPSMRRDLVLEVVAVTFHPLNPADLTYTLGSKLADAPEHLTKAFQRTSGGSLSVTASTSSSISSGYTESETDELLEDKPSHAELFARQAVGV